MYSVNRTIGISTILRSSLSVKSATGQPSYNCDVTAAVICSGLDTHIAKAGSLFLDPITTTYENSLLQITNPRLVIARETNVASLSMASEPPATGKITIAKPSLVVSRLDSVDVDGRTTLEFRLTDIALPAAGTDTTTEYNRIYLIADSAIVDYDSQPKFGTAGATVPGVLHDNVAGGATFNSATDLYLLAASGGATVLDDGTHPVWFDRTSIITAPVWTEEVVLFALELRNIAADEVTKDILKGSATALINAEFRLVL